MQRPWAGTLAQRSWLTSVVRAGSGRERAVLRRQVFNFESDKSDGMDTVNPNKCSHHQGPGLQDLPVHVLSQEELVH